MLNKYGDLEENASLTNYNTYGIKTKCKYLIKPNSKDNLKDLINYLNTNNIKYYILGGGSNVILSDNFFNGVIITLENLNDIKFNNNLVEVSSGINLSIFIMECINHNLSGLENLALIPGTLGGALYGNAGVKDACIYDYIESVEVLSNNEFITIKKEDIKYSYRYSMFKDTKDILVSATFKLEKGKKEEMLEVVKENRIKRLNSQPLEYKNAGSVFKNPEGDYAGRLIEESGLKNYQIGGAKVSDKHANFIINVGNATGSDIRKLIEFIKKEVYNKFKVELELEQMIIDWE